jgi:predicted transposase YdaD
MATYTLMGLRYPVEMAKTLLRGVRQMRESVTYQDILAEGRQEGIQQGIEEGLQQGLTELRRVLLLQGTGLFGPPSPEARARLEDESGIERLEELAQRIIRVKSWDELFS